MAGASSSKWSVLVAAVMAGAAAASSSAAVISDPLADDASEGTFDFGGRQNGGGGGTAAAETAATTTTTTQPRRLRRHTSPSTAQGDELLGLAKRILQTETARAGTTAQSDGRKRTLDRLAERVYSGAAAALLDADEKTLGRDGDPTLADLQGAKGEISEYYWRQLRYATQSHSYLYDVQEPEPEEPAPAPPSHPDLPSKVECTATTSCDGPERTVVVEFHYNVECSGYVSAYELDKLDYAILEEAAAGECDDGDFEWSEERRRRLNAEAEAIEAGPNSVLDILRELEDEDEDEVQEVNNSNNHHRRRKLEIVSIDAHDAHPNHVFSGDGRCRPENEVARAANNCCEERTGYVTVTYDQCHDNATEEEVVANVLRKVQAAMDDASGGIFDNDTGGVVAVVYVGPHLEPPAVMSTSQEMVLASSDQISAGQLAGVLLGMLALLALLALLVARRRRRTDAKDRSVATDRLDGETYVTADYGNLAGRHSKLDVHVCKSALCKECNSSGRPGGARQCLPVVNEESDRIVQELAAIRDRDVVFLRTQGTARGQTTEHVDIDLGSSSSASTASSSPPSTPPRASPRTSEGPAYSEQEVITASLDINRVGSTAQSRII
eukprot:CAMPEP_0181051332 /NCGR_PEP_ID=MMETSP1070-20121207/16995_1 /TAXON_ID=265543 /ORGANISM="Minutocellus polymorphus, Strain NH13" /LENGTH=610 /DNA_ID=CAMNT_0023130341 /DNA_START=113 /DNA_END=1945 /DNA_ORIENTATION=+